MQEQNDQRIRYRILGIKSIRVFNARIDGSRKRDEKINRVIIKRVRRFSVKFKNAGIKCQK
jgi:hypothetical protein